MNSSISRIHAREILDSRGNPTLETEVVLMDGSCGRAAVPSGASTGSHEAVELRDGDHSRYGGKGVMLAQGNVNGPIADLLRGFDATQQSSLDEALRNLDGTENKSKLGANAILSVSLAAAKAAAVSNRLPLYQYLGGREACVLPVPMFNLINGGLHAKNRLDVQECMVIPAEADSFRAALRMGAEIHHALGEIAGSCGLGDEGGYAADVQNEAEAMELLLRAIEKAGYRAGDEVYLALDAAVSDWYTYGHGYRMPKLSKDLARAELCRHWAELSRRYPLLSIEDGMAEDDAEGWQSLTGEIGAATQLVGDDLFVTNPKRIKQGIEEKLANAVLIKPNQIGTLTETAEAIRMAKEAGYATILSHRSGETEDTTIADLAVAYGAGQIKAGAPCRGERTAKYNRLLRIEDELGGSARYAGKAVYGEKLKN
ncbi:MAG: phosphopyruvate hydratase [Oscillospiraceae bacterium]|nr:phosphopyruvate hydratase [Oscillospiraceae bacterium]